MCSNHPIPKRLSSIKAMREIANLDIRVRVPSWLLTLLFRELIYGVRGQYFTIKTFIKISYFQSIFGEVAERLKAMVC